MARDDAELHVRRLWRHRGVTVPGPRRGPKQQLTLDEILDAAVAIADTDGLDAVSTRAVAARFGRTAMALYPYVGTKENLLALMQDHASGVPEDLGESPHDWALALFDLYLDHPWLTERPWSAATQGPNEQDWMELLLRALGDPAPAVVTMMYATVRATAATTVAYRRMAASESTAWLDRAAATARLVPDFAQRYPLATALPPLTPRWQDNPRAALVAAVRMIGFRNPVAGNLSGMFPAENLRDWRGHKVIDPEDAKIGELEAVYVDTATDEPSFATVKVGFIGRYRLVFVPLAGATVLPGALRVQFGKKLVGEAPTIDLDGELTAADEPGVFAHYGLPYMTGTAGERRLARR